MEVETEEVEAVVVVVEVEEEGLIPHVLFAKHDWPPGQS